MNVGEIPVVTGMTKKKGMTNGCNKGKKDNNHNGLIAFSKAAFTMAEILLSLTIIGVVAAITLPSLTGNINERTWNTQRKALYARMSQAIALMPALNGFGTYSVSGSGSDAVVTDTATETFIASGLSKVLKINNICSEKFEDCGIPEKYTPMGVNATPVAFPKTLYSLNGWFSSTTGGGYSYSTNDANAVAFETQNGESVVAYYNRICRTEYLNEESLTDYGDAIGFPEATMCVNFIYDLNGTKGPNTVGKDIGFITVFNSMDSIVVAPMPSSSGNVNNETYIWTDAIKACAAKDSDSRTPNIDELSAMMINKKLINLTESANFWSSSVFNKSRAWRVNTLNGGRFTYGKTSIGYVRCIKR